MGVPDNGEKLQERLYEMHSHGSRPLLLYDQGVLAIPDEHFFAAIVLAGGRAYTEDVRSILEQGFGYSVKHDSDIREKLDHMKPALIWDIDDEGKQYWMFRKGFYLAHRDVIDSAVQKARE